MEYLFSSIIGYLLGSFPTAYIFIKNVEGKDITKEGSGNVGAMNSFEVSNSKVIGYSVFVVDFLKGSASVLIPRFIFPSEFIFPAISLFFAVFAHCYNPWLNFKGGRGLSTAAGGAAFLFPFLLIVWAALWGIIYLMKKNIIIANISSTILSLLVVFSSEGIALKYAFPNPVSSAILVFTSSAVLVIIFIRHIEPLKELISSQKKIFKDKRNEK